MTPTRRLTTEPAAAVWLRQIAPWLIVIAIGAVLMVPGIVFELGHRPTEERPLTTLPAAAGMLADAVRSPRRIEP